MCGICGIYNGGDEGAIQRMLTAMEHRGPDASGCVCASQEAPSLWLGHRRLAIIDLNAAANQPMRNPDTGDILAFNGEIYNYRELRQELQARNFS